MIKSIIIFSISILLDNFFYISLNSLIIFTPLFSLVSLMYIYYFINKKKKYLIICLIFGFIYDLIFNNFYFLNMLLFFIIGLIIVFLNKNKNIGYFSSLLTCIIIIIIYNLLLYFILYFFNYIYFDIREFLNLLKNYFLGNILYTLITTTFLKIFIKSNKI